MPTRTEAIASFLRAKTHPDLADLYNFNMECQVNVAQDGGSATEGEYRGRTWRGWTDGQTTWKSFRIPRNAATNPEFVDSRMSFDLSHAEGVGMTGWDWMKRLSRWVAFDFDAIVGHKAAHEQKMTDKELLDVRELASQIPWVTVRKSAGGRGLHLYVHLDPPIITNNHNEHAALARAILGQMSALALYDFSGRVDICGHNMWVYHRKMLGTGGLELIKKGISLDHVPPNWRDHIKVVSGHSKRNLPSFFRDLDSAENAVASDAETFFAELTGQAVKTPLDEEHKRLVHFLEDQKAQSWWDADHHMLVTHTYFLRKAHEELHLRGIFETISAGSEAPRDHNCFLFPIRRGGWTVRRYSLGVNEAPTWDQDGQGWTRCYFNCDPTFDAIARSKGGLESKTGAYVFNEAEMAVDAARVLGAHIKDLPGALRLQRANMKEHKDGRVLLEIEGDRHQVNSTDMQGWLHDKGKWTRLFSVASRGPSDVSETKNYDDLVRHLITESGGDYGWVIKGTNGGWRSEPLVHVSTALQAMDLNPKEVKTILGAGVIKCWTMVNQPFQPEYPGNRQWNRDAPQFRFVPSQDLDNLSWPTWKKILDHCGAGLDDAVHDNAWARANGLKSGGDYLKVWIASLFKQPTEPLPYLFFHSKEQVTGKSTFHESLSLLITKGYQRADAALINQSGFNDELKDAILCVVEEISLKKNKDANNRIKDWVTARHMPIHPKGKTPYHVINTTHWVQCSNDVTACPIFPGDTRITMIQVPTLSKTAMIRRSDMIPMLEREAPDFLAEILHLEIPPSNDRLNVPMIATAEKLESQRTNESPLETFIREKCFEAPGCMVTLADFYLAFETHVDATELQYWSKIRVGKELPAQYPKGRNPQNGHHYIGNISLTPPPEGTSVGTRLKVELRNGKDAFLVPDHGSNNH